jgi:hypothetical protein
MKKGSPMFQVPSSTTFNALGEMLACNALIVGGSLFVALATLA